MRIVFQTFPHFYFFVTVSLYQTFIRYTRTFSFLSFSPFYSDSFPIKIATPGGMALASPAYSFAPCRAAPCTDYHGSFCLNFTKCNHPLLADARNKDSILCTDPSLLTPFYSDLLSHYSAKSSFHSQSANFYGILLVFFS